MCKKLWYSLMHTQVWSTFKKEFRLKAYLQKKQMNNEWNIFFKIVLKAKETYSDEFSVGQSTTETTFF